MRGRAQAGCGAGERNEVGANKGEEPALLLPPAAAGTRAGTLTAGGPGFGRARSEGCGQQELVAQTRKEGVGKQEFSSKQDFTDQNQFSISKSPE